jgi:hypothetical protein
MSQTQGDDDYYYGDGSFTDYVVTTLDGSPWILVATALFCCSLYCFLPCVVACLNACDRKKQQDGIAGSCVTLDLDELVRTPTALVVGNGRELPSGGGEACGASMSVGVIQTSF